MGYVICAPGGKAGEVGQVNLLQSDDTDLIAAYSMCAEAYNFSILYLEAGSGAHTPVNPNLIRAARAATDNLVLIVGGGIRDGDAARKAVEAGADWIVTGNLCEEFIDALNGVWDEDEEKICSEKTDVCLYLVSLSQDSFTGTYLKYKSSEDISKFEFSHNGCVEDIKFPTNNVNAISTGRGISMNDNIIIGMPKPIVHIASIVDVINGDIVQPILDRIKKSLFFTKPIIEKIKETKFYYSPEKIITDISISESDQLKTMRSLDETETYSLNMSRGLNINYKIFDNLSSKYQITIASDLYHDMEK